MLVNKLIKHILDNGLKKNYVAKKLGISGVYLSQVINKKVDISLALERRIIDFLS